RQRGQPPQGLRRVPRRRRLHPQALQHGHAARCRAARPGRQAEGTARTGPGREGVSGTILQAASVLLRAGPGSRQVYLGSRAPAPRFMGGFVACPGGKVHDSDAALAVAGLSLHQVSAVRELFEETGVLLARTAAGTHTPDSPELARLRRELLAETITF